MILLDTNVVSELMRPRPEAAVVDWMGAQASLNLYVSTVSEAELRYGLALLPAGARRNRMQDEVDGMLREDFAGRILSFNREAARAYAVVGATRRMAGWPISHADCQIAAIALSLDAAVATRNVNDFTHCGIDVVNPWTA